MTATAIEQARQALECDLAELLDAAARVEDVSASEAIRKAGMYLGLVAADLGALTADAAGRLDATDLERLGAVQRALIGTLAAIDQAAAEVTP